MQQMLKGQNVMQDIGVEVLQTFKSKAKGRVERLIRTLTC